MKELTIAIPTQELDLLTLGDSIQQMLIAGADSIFINVDQKQCPEKVKFSPKTLQTLRGNGIDCPISVYLLGDSSEHIAQSFSQSLSNYNICRRQQSRSIKRSS